MLEKFLQSELIVIENFYFNSWVCLRIFKDKDRQKIPQNKKCENMHINMPKSAWVCIKKNQKLKLK